MCAICKKKLFSAEQNNLLFSPSHSHQQKWIPILFPAYSTDTIFKIKQLIIEARFILRNLTPSDLKLWRVNILLSEDDDRFKLLESISDDSCKVCNTNAFVKIELKGKKPNGNTRISNYFSKNILSKNILSDISEDHPGVIMPPPAISEPEHK
ncbi:hypothetical protein BC937DRAFT_87320 [Endogone sp. FLAS-F59071]|nr:hypothetical protein BC937DRAFT_87320 [Endogone sp. FLAS-F59071]|eukprot:RUS19540.1 hypothetical protein BC937DRAFT_87320 [Endogone sp. FLAS-F59071]